MKKYRLKRFFMLTLATMLLGGFVFSKSVFAEEDPLAAAKACIQSELDSGKTVFDAVGACLTSGCCTSECDATAAAIQKDLDTKAVVEAAIAAGGDPQEVGDCAYNSGGSFHDIYRAGGSTSGQQQIDLQFALDDVEQPVDRPASKFVPRDNVDKAPSGSDTSPSS